MAKYKLLHVLSNMKSRCYNPKSKQYADYGGRGITVCDEWRSKGGSKKFFEWAIENGWEPSLTIDRIDVNGNYEPSNCRWATMRRQLNNTRRNHLLTLDGETHTAAEWSRITGIDEDVIYHRIAAGWNDKRIITEKVKKRKPRQR